ncbi:MAG: hypothetical protein MR807_10385 [Erysipelotrichaceae bacterium]|nr:hypothetical protein [Erysipelotrichaceae bacterium]
MGNLGSQFTVHNSDRRNRLFENGTEQGTKCDLAFFRIGAKTDLKAMSCFKFNFDGIETSILSAIKTKQ